MNLLNQLTIKNLRLNKKRTIATIVGIMLSIALITAVASIYTSGVSSIIALEKSKNGNYHYAFINVPVNDISYFENNRSVETFYMTSEIGYAKIEESKNDYKPYAYIMALNTEAMKNLSVRLVEGRFPENENEIMITTHLRNNGRVKWNVGDSVILEVGERADENGYVLDQYNPVDDLVEEEIIDTQKKTYTIVGRMERPAETIEPYDAPGYTMVTYTDGSDLTETVDIYARYTKSGLDDQYRVTANILGLNKEAFETVYGDDGFDFSEYDDDEIEYFFGEIGKAKYEVEVNYPLIALERNPLSEDVIGGLSYVTGIVCVVILITSIFCIKNSFDISITEKIRQYGMLASVGATRKQIKKNVFFEAFILGMIGIPLGMGCGFLASYILIIVSNHYMNLGMLEGLYIVFDFSWTSVLFSCVIGIMTIYLSAVRSARRASKVTPIMAIRNSSEIKMKRSRLKSSKIIRKLFGIGGVISDKNVKRNKKKYRTIVISVTVSVFVFIALSSFINLAYKELIPRYDGYEYNIGLDVILKNGEESIDDKVIQTVDADNIRQYAVIDSGLSAFELEQPKYTDEYVKTFTEAYGWYDEENFDENFDTDYLDIYSVGEAAYRDYIRKLGLDYDDIKDKFILVNTEKFKVFDQQEQRLSEKVCDVFDYQKGDELTLSYKEYYWIDVEDEEIDEYDGDYQDEEINEYDGDYQNEEEIGEYDGDYQNEEEIDEYDDDYQEDEEMDEYEDEYTENVNPYNIIRNRKSGYTYVEVYEETIDDTLYSEKLLTNTIGCVTSERPFGLGNHNGAIIIVSDEYLRQMTSDLEMDSSSDYSNEMYFMADDAMKLQMEIETLLDENDSDYLIDNLDESVRQMKNFYTLIEIFLFGFITVISLIGITNIFNTMTTSMELRKQEFAMLKSIGMTKREFNKMIRLESIFIGTKAFITGSVIGLLLSYVIYYIVDPDFEYEPPVKAVMISGLMVFLLITCIMQYSMNRINKQNTIETIRNENI